MPNRDDDRGFGEDRDGERRREDDRGQDWRGQESEQRSFGQQGRYNSDQARYGPRGDEGEVEAWRAGRYGSRFDQDRADYGANQDRDHGRDAGARRFGGGLEDYGGEPHAYGGQEYGLEAHREEAGGSDWGFEQHGGVQHPSQRGEPGAARPEHEFDPDYLRWRDEQLRAHDRDYQDWRRHQERRYDDEYRSFRSERREHFGRAFHEWRRQRSLVGGVPDTSVAPGVSGCGDRTAIPSQTAAGAGGSPDTER